MSETPKYTPDNQDEAKILHPDTNIETYMDTEKEPDIPRTRNEISGNIDAQLDRMTAAQKKQARFAEAVNEIEGDQLTELELDTLVADMENKDANIYEDAHQNALISASKNNKSEHTDDAVDLGEIG